MSERSKPYFDIEPSVASRLQHVYFDITETEEENVRDEPQKIVGLLCDLVHFHKLLAAHPEYNSIVVSALDHISDNTPEEYRHVTLKTCNFSRTAFICRSSGLYHLYRDQDVFKGYFWKQNGKSTKESSWGRNVHQFAFRGTLTYERNCHILIRPGLRTLSCAGMSAHPAQLIEGYLSELQGKEQNSKVLNDAQGKSDKLDPGLY